MRIEVVPGGPLVVEGIEVGRLRRDEDRTWVERIDAPAPCLVCRCGRSSSMPWCDRSDDRPCFEEMPPTAAEPAPFRWDVPDPAGPPAIALKPDGPIRVAGSVPVVHEDRTLPGRDRVSLCRCGASRCQPLCDGSHKVIGFRG